MQIWAIRKKQKKQSMNGVRCARMKKNLQKGNNKENNEMNLNHIPLVYVRVLAFFETIFLLAPWFCHL